MIVSCPQDRFIDHTLWIFGCALLRALWLGFAKGWEILLPPILAFVLFGVLQGWAPKNEMTGLLLEDAPHSIATTLAPHTGSRALMFKLSIVCRVMTDFLSASSAAEPI
jgi:hypothetical protein